MSDITELAQSLKAAANTTADAIDRLKAFPGDELIDLSQHEGEQVDIDIATLNQWYELSSPANVLALVEALEKAQQRIDELEQEHCGGALMERELAHSEVTGKLMSEIDDRDSRIAELESHKAALLKFIRDSCYVFDGADEDISDAYVDAITSGLIPKLESVTACNPPLFWVRVKSDGGYEGPIHDSKLEEVRKKSGEWLPLTLAGGIPELESRTVTVKLPERYACELGYNAPDPSGDMLDRDDVLAMLADAGIKVEAE